MSKSLVRGSFSQRKSGGVDSRMTVEKKEGTFGGQSTLVCNFF